MARRLWVDPSPRNTRAGRTLLPALSTAMVAAVTTGVTGALLVLALEIYGAARRRVARCRAAG